MRKTSPRLSSARKMRIYRAFIKPSSRGQRYVKRGTRSGHGFYPNPASQALDRGPANRQTDSGSGFLGSVQAPEDPKNVIEILRIDANPVVLHRESPAVLT